MRIIEGKLALITGAGSGIGAATAKEFAKAGGKVIAVDLNLDRASEVVSNINENGGEAWAEQLDITDRDSVYSFASKVREKYGPIDILVNNAGMSMKDQFSESKQTQEIWDKVMAVNLEGQFNVTHAFVEALKETKGAIVNTASVASFAAGFTTAAYTVAKGGIRSFTQHLAKDLGSFGIRTNAVAPGSVTTNFGGKLSIPNYDNKPYRDRCPLGRFGEPEEIANAILFLASDMASYVNGVTLPVDGGFIQVY